MIRVITVAGLIWSFSGAVAVAASFSDIPGDGILTGCCLSNPVGTVSSSAAGALSGTLTPSASALGLLLGVDPIFLTFAGGGLFVPDPDAPPLPGSEDPPEQRVLGPLGETPAAAGVPVPQTGQQIHLTITNTGASTMNWVAFYLLEDATAFSGFIPREDGLTFGLTGSCGRVFGLDQCEDDDLLLLGPPSSTSGNVNPQDLLPGGEMFGDLLRFDNLNLSPSQSATFSFFITDIKGTSRLSTGGQDASASLALGVFPLVQAIPEPQTWGTLAAGCLVFLVMARRRRERLDR
jgi:hypothetical protein